MSFDWVRVCVTAGSMVLTIAVMLLAALRSRLVAVASMFIGLSSGVMLWLLTDMVVDPSYGHSLDDPFWLAFTFANVAALVALCYSVWKMDYRILLLAAAMSSFSLLAPFGVLAGVLIWWDHKKHGL